MQGAAALENRGEMLSIGKVGKGQERYNLDKVPEGAEDYPEARSASPPRPVMVSDKP